MEDILNNSELKETKTSKLESITSVLKDLRKSYSDALPKVSEAGHVDKLITESPQLNYAFGGGYPIGRICEFFGPESGGKTVLSCYIGSQFQQRTDNDKRIVLYVDMEHSFEEKYARTVGLDLSDKYFIFVRPLNGEEGFTIVERLVRTNQIGLIVWDSIAATPSESQMSDEYGKASFGGTAKVFSEGLKKINPYISRFKTSLQLINQVRAKIGGMPSFGPQENTTGGYAPKFYSSWRARISKMEDIVDKKEVIGNQIKIKNVKSKIGMPKRTGQMNLLYGSGFNPDSEYIDFIKKLQLVSSKGAGWMSNEEWGFRGQGDSSLLDFLCSKPELFKSIKDTVNNTFASHSILDENEIPDSEAELELALLDAAAESELQ
jgi:recombination protein RecA